MSKQQSLFSDQDPRQLTTLPPQHVEPTEINCNQVREGDTVLVRRRGAEKELIVHETKGGLFLLWPLCGAVRFYKNTGRGPGGWRVVKVVKRAPGKKK